MDEDDFNLDQYVAQHDRYDDDIFDDEDAPMTTEDYDRW
jgi:hypothetical protein